MLITEYLDGQSKKFHIILNSALLILVGIADYQTGTEISLSVFYLLPLSLATWYTNRWIGILFCVLSPIVWLCVDSASGHTYSHVVILYWNALVRLCFFLMVSILLTKLKSSLIREKELARTDALTGLLNMRAFYDVADIEIKRTRRFERPFTIAYMDVDNFKMVNDRLGHETGNTLLRSIAETLKINIRATDVTARLGGDEFVLLLGETGRESADIVFRRLQKEMTDVFERNRWPVRLSIGAVTYNKPPETVDDMLKKADNVMYSSKKSGRNEIICELVD